MTLQDFCSTVEDEIFVDPLESSEIVDDFEIGQDEAVDIKDKEINKHKLKRRINQYKVSIYYQSTLMRNICNCSQTLCYYVLILFSFLDIMIILIAVID